MSRTRHTVDRHPAGRRIRVQYEGEINSSFHPPGPRFMPALRAESLIREHAADWLRPGRVLLIHMHAEPRLESSSGSRASLTLSGGRPNGARDETGHVRLAQLERWALSPVLMRALSECHLSVTESVTQ